MLFSNFLSNFKSDKTDWRMTDCAVPIPFYNGKSFAAKKLESIASGKLLELCCNDSRIKDRTHIELDLRIFSEGLLCEYVKYCRGYSSKTLDDLYEYTKYWVTKFIALRLESFDVK